MSGLIAYLTISATITHKTKRLNIRFDNSHNFFHKTHIPVFISKKQYFYSIKSVICSKNGKYLRGKYTVKKMVKRQRSPTFLHLRAHTVIPVRREPLNFSRYINSWTLAIIHKKCSLSFT